MPWFQKLLASRRPAATSKIRKSARLGMEALETRLVPTTFTGLQLQEASQYMLQLVNRARANPTAEAARFGIDLNEGLAPGTISSAPKQPLAMNAALETAIENHLTSYLNSTAFWSVDGNEQLGAPNPHTGLGDGTPETRIANAGYGTFNKDGENLGALWSTGTITDLQATVDQLERNLFVDQGTTGRGHRLNLLDGAFQEAGVGVDSGLKPAGQSTGSNLVVAGQDFAVNSSKPSLGDPNGSGAFVTGIVYRDVNANGQYDMAEELQGVRVTFLRSDGVTGSTTVSETGGFAMKLAPGQWTVTFSGGSLAQPITRTVTIASTNVEVDVAVTNTTPTPPATPTVTAIGNQVGKEGDVVSLQVNALNATAFTATGLPPGLHIDNHGLISGTMAAGSAGTYSVSVTALDGTVAANPVTFTWTVNHASTAPQVIGAGNQVNTEGDTVKLQLHFVNANGYHYSGLPVGLSMDNTGLITGKLPVGSARTYTVTVTAFQGTVASTPYVFTWTVNASSAPQVIGAGNQVNTEGDTVKLQLHFVNANGYHYSGLPVGLAMDSTGLITGKFPVGSAGTYTVTVTAFQGSVASAPYVFTWTVKPINTVAAVVGAGNQVNKVGDTVNVQLQFLNANGYSYSGLPLGLSMNSAGLITGKFPAGSAGIYHVTVTAFHNGIASNPLVFTWTVNA